MTIVITAPVANAFLGAAATTVTGTVSAGAASVTVNGQAATLNGNNWTASITLPAGDGAKTITVVATDTANTQTTATVNVTLDVTAPAIAPAVTPAPNAAGWNHNDTTVSFTCTDATSGIATCTASTTLTAETSSQSVTGTAVDRAGNQTPASVTVKLDKTAPAVAVQSPATGATLSSTQATITGTVTDARSGVAAVTCGSQAATLASGSFTCSVTLVSGANDVLVAATDVAGNTATTTVHYTVNLDQQAPVVTITAPVDGSFTKVPGVTVTGTATDDVAVASVTVNGQAVTLTGNNWTVSITLPAGDGSKSITAIATDTANKQSTTSINVVLDSTTPAITATVAPAPNAAGWNRADVTVSFTCTDATSGIDTCTAATTLTAETSSQSVTGTAVDHAGNQATTSVTVRLDKTAPIITVQSPASGATVTTTPMTITGAITDALSGVANVTCASLPASLANGTFTCSVALVAGGNDIPIVATDVAGNTATTSAHYTLSTDSQAPIVTITTPIDGAFTKVVSVTVTGSASDDQGIASVMVNGQAATLTAGNWTATITLAGSDGGKTIAALATDTFGNQSAASISIVLDRDPPTIAGTAAPAPNAAGWNNTNVTVTFTCTDATSGVATCSAPVTVNAEGTQTVTGIATDKAGNSASASAVVKLDNTAPVLTVQQPLDNSTSTNGTITISGTVSDALSGVQGVTCAGTPATLTAGTFSCTATLTAGANAIAVAAVDIAGNTVSQTLHVTLSLDTIPPTIQAFLSPQPTADGWSRAPVTVSFDCSDAGSGIATCASPQTITTDGTGQVVTGSATDNAGNSATASVTLNVDSVAPSLTVDPAPATTRTSPITLHGSAADALSGLLSVTCGASAAVISGSTFTCAAEVSSGANALTVTATDRAGNATDQSIEVFRDSIPPLVVIDEPVSGTSATSDSIVVRGHANDEDLLVSITVNGLTVTQADGSFEVPVPLHEGANTITAIATDRSGNTASASIVVNRFSVPQISITSPADLAVLNDATITVSGTVSDPAASVSVNGVTALVSGGNFTAAGVPLAQGRTVVTATATSAAGHVTATTVHVYRDSIPPRLAVYAPADGAVVYDPTITVTGMVDDIVIGTINAGQMRVTVNGVEAQVLNRGFLASQVPLAAGDNVLILTATDAGHNTVVMTHHVTLAAPNAAHLVIVDGNDQTGMIATYLQKPLTVRYIDATGAPIAGARLIFSVVSDNGSLLTATDQARSVSVITDVTGTATARWVLGTRAGAGSNRVQVHAAAGPSVTEFDAVATTGPPALIVIDSGNLQFGITGSELARPFTAAVVDAGGNRIPDVPVTFTMKTGDGNFGGQPAVIVVTDSDGRASARATLGSEAGQDNNVFVASLASTPATAVFAASGRAAGPVDQTRISGVILDNTDQPVPGVTVRIDGTAITAQADATGRFTIPQTPVGYVKMFIDGSTAQRDGTWPMLEYAVYTLPGVDNNIGMPIYLLPIDVPRGIFVDETHGGTLTLPELPGFALSVAPGAATFPGGSRTGTISVTLVHADKMPMPPGFGQQPRFIVTIQPPGVHFDPPAAISFPNVDGHPPGTIVEMYSFDHDLGQFVSIGTGSVTEDGSSVRSDPGVGIIKGGWHCSGDPETDGNASHCAECLVESGGYCLQDTNRQNLPCTDDRNPCTYDICRTGRCKHMFPNVSGNLTSPEDFKITTDTPTDDPKMPEIDSTLFINGVVPDPTLLARWRWELKFEYTDRIGRRVNYNDPPVEGGNKYKSVFLPFYGGDMTLTAFLLRGVGKRECFKTVGTHKVLGVNPTVAQIDAYLQSQRPTRAALLHQMVCQESRFHQFNPGSAFTGYPNETPSMRTSGAMANGVGLLQLTDPVPSDEAYWQWKVNLSERMTLFAQKEGFAVAYMNRVQRANPTAPAWTNEMLEAEILRQYNGLHEWQWDAPTAAWVHPPPVFDPFGRIVGERDYVRKVLSCQ